MMYASIEVPGRCGAAVVELISSCVDRWMVSAQCCMVWPAMWRFCERAVDSTALTDCRSSSTCV
eukprot:4982545-Amphidinium_carterae.1